MRSRQLLIVLLKSFAMVVLFGCSPSERLINDTPSANAILEDDDGIGGGGGTSDFGTPNREIILQGVPWVSQIFTCSSWDQTRTCGPTSAAMAISFINKIQVNETLVKDLVTSLGQTWPCGNYTSVTTISNLLTQKGVPNTVKIFDATQLVAALDAGHPIITPVYGQDFSTNQIKTSGNIGHFMLVIGANATEIIVNDPGRSLPSNGAYRHFRLNDFTQAWWGNGKYKGIEVGTSCQGAATQSCGTCGTQTRTCMAGGVWSSWSSCITGSCSNPMISISPNQGTRGSSFLLSGSGFTPNAVITPSVRRPDGSMPQLPQTTASGNGSLSYTLQTSSSTLIGTFMAWATDATSGKMSNQLSFSITGGGGTSPTISVSPSQGAKSTTFVINGSGFTSNASVTISVTKPDSSVASFQWNTDGMGTFQYNLNTNAMTLIGAFSATATDGINTSNRVNFNVT